MRVLVCGGRDYDDYSFMAATLDSLGEEFQGIECVIHGGARGADAKAGLWASMHGICEIIVPSNWDFYGKRAGPLRNGWMLRFCAPDVVVAFPGGRGTSDMVAQAQAAGIRVIGIAP